MTANRAFINALRAAFEEEADAAAAPAMQAYMKSAMPFHGLAAPKRRALTAEALIEHPLQSAQELRDTAAALWREAAHREERYAASELPRQRAHREWLTLAWLPLLEEMITTGAWWDHCDEITGQTLAPLLEREPRPMKTLVRRWMVADDLWLRRASMLIHRGVKRGFDAPLFYEALLANLPPAPHSGDFFIRKGMGWALRERAYVAPDEVRAFCAEYADRVSALTRREALRVIDRAD